MKNQIILKIKHMFSIFIYYYHSFFIHQNKEFKLTILIGKDL